MRTLTSILMIVLILSSCDKRPLKNDHDKQNQADSLTMDSIACDTSKILIAELPEYFDSTEYLIYPIGFINRTETESKRNLEIGAYSDRDYSNSGFSIDSQREDYFSGNVTNLVFENIKNHNQTLLTEKVLNITSVQYLRKLSKKINRHYILYTVKDKDMNHDSKLDYQDINSLYISRVDGSEFKKITNNSHQYSGGEMIIENLRYYFRTIEDINRDGAFTQADKYHYFYIDFANDDYKIVEHNPLKLIIK